jgi:hypothetical protein
LTDDQKDPSRSTFHWEDGIPVFENRLNEVERKASAAEIRDEQYKNSQRRINFWLVVFTGLLVLTSLISGGISVWQARIANRSAEAAKSAAQTAGATLDESKRAFKTEQRAYVTPQSVAFDTEPQPGKSVGLTLTLNNSGRTPATKCTYDTRMEVNGKVAPAYSPHETGGVIASQEVMHKHYIVNFSHNKADFNAGAALAIKGSVEYHDIFKDCHVTTFCAVYDGGERVFKFCSTGNELDEQPCASR